MYARSVNRRDLTFAVSGKLVRNSLIMYDRETHSLWSHLTGGAVEGPLRGARLQVVTATQTSWAAWRRAHPDTRVLPHDYPGQTDEYAGYFRNGDAGILGRKRDDHRLSAKARVLGIRILDHPKAYSLDAVGRAKVVNDTFADVPLVVLATADQSAAAFRRDVAEQILTFTVGPDRTVLDQETGSTWDPVTGRAVAGPLAGESLTSVPATDSFWFGWFDFFPGTALYR